MTWLELCDDKRFQDLPYKIELTKAGKIIMSPTRNRHGYFAGRIAKLLTRLMSGGEILVECAVETEDSTKVADVAWATEATFVRIKDEASCSVAPEICIEVFSPSNTEEEISGKKDLYLSAGAKEVWLCDEHGRLSFFTAQGPIAGSLLCSAFPLQVGTMGNGT
jgi:Uma2 family endonuclease